MFNLSKIPANLLAILFFAPLMKRKNKCKNFLFEPVSADKYFGQLMKSKVARVVNKYLIEQIAS